MTDRITEIEQERIDELSEKLWFFDHPKVVKHFIQSDSARIRELISIARSERQAGFNEGKAARKNNNA